MQIIINGIQQIGIGVADAKAVFNWYRRFLGFDILVFEDNATAKLMLRYTGGQPRDRYAILAMNLKGGGGLEIWQFKKRIPSAPVSGQILLGDYGIYAMKIRSGNLEATRKILLEQTRLFVSDICDAGLYGTFFFFKDPWGNLVQVIRNDYQYSTTKLASGGVIGVTIGVADMKRSLAFYAEILGYDKIVSDSIGIFSEFINFPGGAHKIRRTLLRYNKRAAGGFGELLGPSEIELIQVLDRTAIKIYKDRIWGDLGYIHLCFDIYGMHLLKDKCKAKGHPFTVDSKNTIDMGQATGHFSYIEDPDGTLIEFVETLKVPIIRRLGLFIHLKKRDPEKPLPRWLVNTMRIRKKIRDL